MDVTIGQIVDSSAKRDAIHVPIMPAVAGEFLRPGEKVTIRVPECTAYHQVVDPSNSIGVVDPFLLTEVRKGERFYIFLKPGTVGSLRHDWDHPAFPKQDPDMDDYDNDYYDDSGCPRGCG